MAPVSVMTLGEVVCKHLWSGVQDSPLAGID